MNILDATYLVVDTETTGIDPATNQIVEFAAVVTSAREEIDHASTLVNPGRPIPPEASAIHHIIDEDVAEAPGIGEAIGPIMLDFTAQHGPFAAYAAHNAPFDAAFLPAFIDAPWLDTLRLAKRLHPEYEQHGNEYLRYREGISYPGIREENAHRALHDARVTAALLRRYLQEIASSRADFPQDVDGLIRFIAQPMVLAGPVQFGKHKGRTWPQVTQVDRGYLAWIVKQPDMDIDTRATAQHYLGYR